MHTNTPHSSPGSRTRLARCATYAASVLALSTLVVACGGGDDNDDNGVTTPSPAPQALLSDCAPPSATGSRTATYAFQNYPVTLETTGEIVRATGEMESVDTWGEANTLANQAYLRDRRLRAINFSAPQPAAGNTLHRVEDVYFTPNADGTRGINVVAQSSVFTHVPAKRLSTVNSYTPAYTSLGFAPVAPGYVATSQGSEETTIVAGSAAPTTSSGNYQFSETYAGQETVTVPAGTFETCKVVDIALDGTAWFQKGTGLLVKSQGGNGTTFELVRVR